MNKQKLPYLLGGAMIIAGTAIGAGMLANPTSMSNIWFVGSVIMLLFTCSILWWQDLCSWRLTSTFLKEPTSTPWLPSS